MKELTEEQIEKAAISLWQIMDVRRNQIWRDLAEVYKELYRERAKLLAQMLQYAPAPPQLSGDVVVDMHEAWSKAADGPYNMTLPHKRMAAAAQVLLERVCEESKRILCGGYEWRDDSASKFADHVCSSILKPAPPTLEDRVRVISRSGGDRYEVRVDRELKYTFDGNEKADAEIYAAGCIAELTHHTEASHDRT